MDFLERFGEHEWFNSKSDDKVIIWKICQNMKK